MIQQGQIDKNVYVYPQYKVHFFGYMIIKGNLLLQMAKIQTIGSVVTSIVTCAVLLL